METRRMILARLVEIDVTLTNMLPWQPDVRFSKKISFCRRILRKSILALICLNFTFSTIFSVKNGHRAIKVHVNKVQYCRAGHIFFILQLHSVCYFSDIV